MMNDQQQSALPAEYSVLLIDDDERVRHALAWFFRHSAGWRLLDAAADDASALQQANE